MAACASLRGGTTSIAAAVLAVTATAAGGARGRGLDFIQAISTSADTCFMGLKGLGSS